MSGTAGAVDFWFVVSCTTRCRCRGERVRLEAGDTIGSPDGQPMEGTTYLEHSALRVSLDSGLRKGCHVWNH